MEGDEILGSWMSGGWRIRLEIKRESEGYFGVLSEGLENGEKDSANPDQGLRGRPLLGIRLFEGMRFAHGIWSGGRIYDPVSGRSYSLVLRLAGDGALDMRAYIGLKWIGMSQRWTRLGERSDFSAERIAAEASLDEAIAWSPEKAQAWYRAREWPVGCNYIPRTAINQIEMWSASSFDSKTIEAELSLAQSLGFNCLRVYLHDLVWAREGRSFLERIDRFLGIAAGKGLKTMFVVFDDCWNDAPRYGKQPRPRKGVHNSGWVRSPGSALVRDESRWPQLNEYVDAIVSTFKSDERIYAWDLYNEIGNSVGFLPESTRLLGKAFLWARRAHPEQPLTAGIWKRSSWFSGINEFLGRASDIVSFHNYAPLENLRAQIEELSIYGKPLICSEYMARSQGSLFSTHLPLFKEKRVGAFNWGLVAGKTQTIYPWGSRRGAKVPATWFHDIFRADGMAYDEEEARGIRETLSE
jgi:uncharacterized protein (DUF2147 family)